MLASPIRQMYQFNRAAVTTVADTTREVLSIVFDGTVSATRAMRDAGATAVGQARSAVDRSVAEAGDNVKSVAKHAGSAATATAETTTNRMREAVGQARAQGRRAAEQVDRAAASTADRATRAVDGSPSSGTPYEQWTKADLYDRAQELDIEGRASMNKRQLISALRAA